MKTIILTKISVSILFVLGLISCFNQNEKKLNEAETIVFKFYDWYLKDIYLKKRVEVPEIKISNDSSYYFLDYSKHIEFLNESGFFSKKFYENEREIFTKCESALKELNPKTLKGNPAYEIESECDVFCYMNWTRGQGEPLNKIEIVKSVIENDKATVFAAISDSTVKVPYSAPIVRLEKENNDWKIVRIEFQEDK